jgi:1-aminocyclopropane-1-carboxylate synthase
MKEDMTNYINTHVRTSLSVVCIPDDDTLIQNNFSVQCCTYGEGYTGTQRLRTAMAKQLNAYFQPVQAFDAEEITFAAGVTSINEVCAMITCNPDSGDSIMLGSPVYGTFSKDMGMRTG